MEKEFRNITMIEEKVRNIRINLQLTQKEFGKILGISKSYMSDIENGYSGLSIEHINKVCNFARVSFDYLFGFSDTVSKDIIRIEHINLKMLGNHLKTIRKELNYTQAKLASKLNVSRVLIAHYEKGIRTIRTSDLKQICELSGYSADWCIGKLKNCPRRKAIQKIKPKEIKELISN